MVIGSVATFPRRYDTAWYVIRGISTQLDRLYVYVNDHGEDPEWLGETPENTSVVLARNAGGCMADVGKFWWSSRAPQGSIHCTFDDDISYPDDYVRQITDAVEQYDRRAVVSYHGCLLPTNGPVESYYREGQQDKKHFRARVDRDMPAHVVGTGVMAYPTDLIRFPVSSFLTAEMADLWVAQRCNEQGVPRLVLSHDRNWLRPRKTPDPGLYEKYRDDDPVQTWIVNSTPWDTHENQLSSQPA